MSQTVVAIVGISGVGKTTLINMLAAHISFQHLQASVLIREEMSRTETAKISTDSLRLNSIEDNQRLLISGFRQAVEAHSKLVLLDGHTVVDSNNGLIRISPNVFRELRVAMFIFLADHPEAIAQRRAKDVNRNRPIRSPYELAHHQDEALLNAFRATRELNIPLRVITPTQEDYMKSLLREIQ